MKPALPVLAVLICGCEKSNQFETDAEVEPPSVEVVFIGDSIMAHWESLAELVPNSVNSGIGGEITEQMLARFDRDVLAYHPSVVVIEGGINDIASLFGPTPRHVAMMAERASTQGARVILMAITPVKLESWVSELSDIWNDELRITAQSYGYIYLDAGALLRQNENYLYSDGVHITPEGYKAMWPSMRFALANSRCSEPSCSRRTPEE